MTQGLNNGIQTVHFISFDIRLPDHVFLTPERTRFIDSILAQLPKRCDDDLNKAQLRLIQIKGSFNDQGGITEDDKALYSCVINDILNQIELRAAACEKLVQKPVNERFHEAERMVHIPPGHSFPKCSFSKTAAEARKEAESYR